MLAAVVSKDRRTVSIKSTRRQDSPRTRSESFAEVLIALLVWPPRHHRPIPRAADAAKQADQMGSEVLIFAGRGANGCDLAVSAKLPPPYCKVAERQHSLVLNQAHLVDIRLTALTLITLDWIDSSVENDAATRQGRCSSQLP